MNLSRFSLILSSLIFGGIGFACLFIPQTMASGVDIFLSNSTAVIDFRATYGGFLIGMGLFFIFSVFRRNFIRPALFVQALSLGGFAFGRLIGLILDGDPKPIIYYLMMAEISGVILAVFCLWKISQTESDGF